MIEKELNQTKQAATLGSKRYWRRKESGRWDINDGQFRKRKIQHNSLISEIVVDSNKCQKTQTKRVEKKGGYALQGESETKQM